MPDPAQNNIQDHVRSFRRGEEAGFIYFFNFLYRPLVYYAFRIVDDQRIAEEIVEDAFYKDLGTT